MQYYLIAVLMRCLSYHYKIISNYTSAGRSELKHVDSDVNSSKPLVHGLVILSATMIYSLVCTFSLASIKTLSLLNGKELRTGEWKEKKSETIPSQINYALFVAIAVNVPPLAAGFSVLRTRENARTEDARWKCVVQFLEMACKCVVFARGRLCWQALCVRWRRTLIPMHEE